MLSSGRSPALSVVAVAFLCGCVVDVSPPGTPPPPPPQSARPSEDVPIRVDVPPGVPDLYRWVYDHPRGKDAWEAARLSLPFTSITLARSGCLGVCPVYTVSFRADGTATFAGVRNVERTGRFLGSVSVSDFGRLALMAERAGFMELDARYAAPWTDDETLIVTVVPRAGEAKVVVDYGRFGPPDLWALEQALIGLAADVRWVPDVAGSGR
jgi:hypothetical protein